MGAKNFLEEAHDVNNPNPWLALYLDQSTPLPNHVKHVWLTDLDSISRQYVLPFMRPLARSLILLIQVLKVFMPRSWTSSLKLHRLLVWGMKKFVSPEANWLVMRHFHLGSQVLAFIEKNAPVNLALTPIEPVVLDDLKDSAFLKHDLNLYNFIIHLNQALIQGNAQVSAVAQPNFDCIFEPAVSFDKLPKQGLLNRMDLQTAIEIFTPIFQLFLSDQDFWRTTNSLQLDETIALYVATILQKPEHLVLLNNKHPLVPISTLKTASRLVLHGLSTEMLHCLLMRLKAQAA